MTASIILREFENAAYTAQNSNPKASLVYRTDTPPDEHLSVSDRKKQVNQKTWNVFKTCLLETIGEEKYKWICRRYKFNAEKWGQEGKPLLAEHVELFSIGAAQQFTRDVKRLCPTGTKIKHLLRAEIQEKLKESQGFDNILGRHLDPQYIGGTPSDFMAWFIHNTPLMDREKQLLFSDVGHLTFPAYLERFSKSITNRELQEKQIIPAPGADGNLDYYRVYKKISTGHGLVAYALKPAAMDSTLKPFIIFRQTQMAPSHEDTLPSVFNDFENVVGKSGYTPAKPLFDRLMNDPSFLAPGAMVNIAGYSLGGAHGLQFLTDFHSRVSEAYFYSNPSIDAESAERFARETQASNREDNPLKISIFRVVGDICTYTGEKHLGWNVDPNKVKVELIEIDHENKKIDVLSLHSVRLFDTNQLNYRIRRIENQRELSDHLDNTKRGAEVIWYERMRRIWGKIIYGYLFVVYAILKGLGNLFGVKILRSSQDIR